LYDDRKQADRAAVVQAFADPVVVELMEKMAQSCKERRRKGGECWYASYDASHVRCKDANVATVEY
jgi:hypothetical protein